MYLNFAIGAFIIMGVMLWVFSLLGIRQSNLEKFQAWLLVTMFGMFTVMVATLFIIASYCGFSF
jgi:hypothetical protein